MTGLLNEITQARCQRILERDTCTPYLEYDVPNEQDILSRFALSTGVERVATFQLFASREVELKRSVCLGLSMSPLDLHNERFHFAISC